MALTLRKVRYFMAVAERGSLSRAAQDLGTSPSTVAEALKALQDDLRAQLFVRTAKGLTLTHKGHQFLRHAQNILATVSSAERSLRADDQPMIGEVHLGVTGLVAGYYLADLLARHRRAYPNVRVEVIEDSREYVEHLLVNGELDIAALIVSNLGNQMALESEILVNSAYRLWLPASHRLLDLDEVRLSDLRNEPFILLGIDELEQSSAAYLRAAGVRPPIALRTSSVEAVRSLVATGAGITILPDLAYRPWSLEGDRIEIRPIVDALPTLEVGLSWRRGAPLSPAAANFLEVAREHRPALRPETLPRA